MAPTPEQLAREQIDDLLTASGWVLQNYKELNLGASRGIAFREDPLKTGPCDYLLLVDRKAPHPYNAMVGMNWEFEVIGAGPQARMFLNRSVSDLRDESSWDQLYQWFGEKLTLFYEHVPQKLREDINGGESA